MIAQSLFGLASLALVNAQTNITSSFENVTLYTQADNSTLDDKFLTALHEGAGISVVFLANSTVEYYFNSTDNTVVYPSEIANAYPMVLSEYSNSLSFSVTGPPYATIDSDNYVTINGSNSVFYVCDSVPMDPYGYSEYGLGVSVYGSNDTVPSDCQSIKILARDFTALNGTNGTYASGSARPSGSVSASSSARRSASSSGSAHRNTTVGTYTKTQNKTITVDSATTLTEPDTTYIFTHKTTATVENVETVTVTGALTSAVATVSVSGSESKSSNGANKFQIGAAGLLAAVAALI